MKKVLIVIPSFEIGGTIVSLQSLLKNINTQKVKVDIYARNHIGPFIHSLQNVVILGENIWLASAIHEKPILYKLLFLCLKIIRNLFKFLGVNLYPLYSHIGGKQIGSEKYDAVVSYQEDINRVVCFYPAKKRIAWIHCDYQRYLALINENDESRFYKRFDKVVCVSYFVKRTFDESLPQYKDRSICIYNIIDQNYINSKANESIEIDPLFKTDTFVIVSIGRMDPVKQFSAIPKIANELKSLYDDSFVWYIIGGPPDSEERKTVDKMVLSYGLEDYVKCLNEKTNIYPYIKKSDLLVHTSKSESFSLVVNEAMALGVPVVMNDIEVAPEVIQEGVNGIITDIDSMGDAIHKVINRKCVFVHKDFKVEDTVEKFYSII